MAEYYKVTASMDGQAVVVGLVNGTLGATEDTETWQHLDFKQALNLGRLAMHHEGLRGVQIVAAA
jgi:hypothetical protein